MEGSTTLILAKRSPNSPVHKLTENLCCNPLGIILLDFPLSRYEGCDNWNNLPGKIATHQKTVSVTRSVDQHHFGLLTIDKILS
jgi:hypothetical protein